LKTIRSLKYIPLLAHLKRARRHVKLSQQELAERLRKPQSYVSKMETGERRADLMEFIEWADALGQDPVELFSGLVKGTLRPSTKLRDRRGRRRKNPLTTR